MGLREETQPSKPFESLQTEVYLNLRRTTHLLQLQAESLFRSHGLTETQYNALRILRGAGDHGLPSLEVGRRLVASVPDITRLVDRLVRDGLAFRQPCPADRRVTYVRLTPRGLELTGLLEAPLLEFHRQQLAQLTEEELALLNQLLEKARQNSAPS